MLTAKISLAIATLALGSALSQAAFAQGATTLRDPLIPGAQSTMPGIPAADGQPPPPGDGPTPVGVTPGQSGPPTLEPWMPCVPADQVNVMNSGISLPVGPPVETPPGVLGPSLTGVVPSEPSTPGAAPGSLTAPQGYTNPAQLVNINAAGGLPGTGGYYGSIPRVRRGGQITRQLEERGARSIFGGGGNAQDEVTLMGPLAGTGVPFGLPTGYGYNNGPAGSNNDLRQSSIDLGGGQRLKMGGQTISTGGTIQDMGTSATRNNSIAALHAHQSTEFGQGYRGEPIYTNNTTSFGLPYRQFNAANVNPQKQGQLLVPTSVLTNK